MPQVQSESPVANGVVADTETHAPHTFWALTLGSMGVVFGDIGTSPLYAFRVALQAAAEQVDAVGPVEDADRHHLRHVGRPGGLRLVINTWPAPLGR